MAVRMLTEYAYVKPRSQFGKYCNFRIECVAEENVMPEPRLMRNYTIRAYTHREVQTSKQYAVHEVRTGQRSNTEPLALVI